MKRRSGFRPALIAAVSILSSLPLGALTRSYEIIQMPSEMPNDVTDVFVAPGGHIWCSTDEGLLRIGYDSYDIYTAASTASALPGDVIYQTFIDFKGNLWVSTDKGVALYDRQSDTFTPLKTDADGQMTGVVAYSHIEYQGKLLLGGVNNLYAYDYESGAVSVKCPLDFDDPFHIHAMYQGRNGNIILLDKDKGFLEYSCITGEVRRFSVDFPDNYCYLLDSHNRFWRSVYGKGIECYDASCRLMATYTTENSGLSCNVVNCIAEKDNEIWVGTELGGINIIHPQTGEIEVLSKKIDDPNSFPSNSISSIYSDSNGTVWASMSSGGIVRIKQTIARSFFVSPSVTRGQRPSLMPVTSVVPDDLAECVWVGTQSGGIYRYDRSDGSFGHCPSTGMMNVASMASFDAGRLIFFDITKGLYLFTKSTGAVTPFAYSDPGLDRYMFDTPESVDLENDYDGNVLIMAEDVYRIIPRDGRVEKISLARSHPEAFNAVKGAGGQDFYCTEHIHRWSADRSSMDVLVDFGSRTINDVALDRNGRYWVASDEGLFVKTPSDTSFTKISTTLFESASIVVCDKLSRVWVGAGENLFIYNPDTATFILTDSSEGIFPDRLLANAVATSTDGHIFLGGYSCFVDIDSSEQIVTYSDPVLSLCSVSVDNVPQSIDPYIKLPRSYGKLSFRVFASEDNILRKKLFRFHITGPEHDDVIVSEQSEYEVRYRHPGRYSVEVSCTTETGEWTDPVDVLSFKIGRPWYSSLAFVLTTLLLLAALAFVLGRDLLGRKKLQVQHDSDKERLRFLLNVSHELKTPLTLIIGPLERLMEEEEKGTKRYQRMVGIRRQALRMRTLILTVLDSHKIEEGAASLNASPVDMNDWVKGVALDFKDEMEGRNIELKLAFSPAVGKVPIDADKLINVLTNMLINAMKHSPNDTTVTVGTTVLEDGATLRTFVSDQGSGLGGVDMSKLFGRYYQAMTEKTGTGMGLAYSDSIVRLHGGSMGAVENPDVGSTFYFDIPLSRS